MQTVAQAIAARHSIRRFRPDPVPSEAIRQMLEAARLAPSGTNSQPWRFIVARDAEERRKLREAAFGQRQLEEAPVVMVCCGDLKAYEAATQGQRRRELADSQEQGEARSQTVYGRLEQMSPEQLRRANVRRALIDVSLAVGQMMLTAVHLGLGTCWVGGFAGPRVREIFSLPETAVVVSLLAVGYPAQTPQRRPRLPLEELVLRPGF